MSVSVAHAATATVTEILPGNTDSAADARRTVIHDQFDIAATLNGGTSPPVTKVAEFILTLTSGAASIDLTALNGTNGAVVTGLGLQPQIVRVKNLGANALTIKGGASNGHSAFTATDGVVIPPGGYAQFYFADGTQDIASGDRIWDVTGTGAQTSQWTILLG